MSRFDNELTKTADNAWQQSGAPKPTTGEHYDQTTNPFPGAILPDQLPVADELGDWKAGDPGGSAIDVTDLDRVDTDVVGGPGSSAVYTVKGPQYAAVEESLYSVYKASREIRDAIDTQQDFDFSGLFTAAAEANDFVRTASTEQDLVHTVGTIAGIVNDIENELVVTSNYKQAYEDLKALESLTETINKVAADSADAMMEKEESDHDEDDVMKTTASKTETIAERIAEREKRIATNGNQETLQITDVRDLDDSGSHFTKEDAMTPDHVTNVEVAENVNGEDAGYVNYYNDGAETGKTPQVDDDTNPWPFDGTNPALVGYQGTVAAVQASREKIFEALQVVERLEKLGMVNNNDRAKHIAKFEQMSDSKLEGFKASLDMLEESGARQPRSQKVASGNNRLPEMGRMTTASSVTRQDLLSDDWLMTL